MKILKKILCLSLMLLASMSTAFSMEEYNKHMEQVERKAEKRRQRLEEAFELLQEKVDAKLVLTNEETTLYLFCLHNLKKIKHRPVPQEPTGIIHWIKNHPKLSIGAGITLAAAIAAAIFYIKYHEKINRNLVDLNKIGLRDFFAKKYAQHWTLRNKTDEQIITEYITDKSFNHETTTQRCEARGIYQQCLTANINAQKEKISTLYATCSDEHSCRDAFETCLYTIDTRGMNMLPKCTARLNSNPYHDNLYEANQIAVDSNDTNKFTDPWFKANSCNSIKNLDESCHLNNENICKGNLPLPEELNKPTSTLTNDYANANTTEKRTIAMDICTKARTEEQCARNALITNAKKLTTIKNDLVTERNNEIAETALTQLKVIIETNEKNLQDSRKNLSGLDKEYTEIVNNYCRNKNTTELARSKEKAIEFGKEKETQQSIQNNLNRYKSELETLQNKNTEIKQKLKSLNDKKTTIETFIKEDTELLKKPNR